MVLFALLFALAACGDTNSTQTNAGPSDSLPTSTELLVGTFRLEDTDLAVTADQAKTLLPLWEMLQSLSSSSTAATEEIDAVVNQIKSTMTSEQMDEITSLNLTQQDVMALMGQNGGFGSNGTQGASTPMAFNGMPDDPSGGGDSLPVGSHRVGCRQVARRLVIFRLMRPGLGEQPACPQPRRRYDRMIWPGRYRPRC